MSDDAQQSSGIKKEDRDALRALRGLRSNLGSARRDNVRSTPTARRYAEEKGIDINEVTGYGPQGRISKEDIDRYIEQRRIFAKQQSLGKLKTTDAAGIVHTEEASKVEADEDLEKPQDNLENGRSAGEKESPDTETIVPVRLDEEEPAEKPEPPVAVIKIFEAKPLAITPLAKAMAETNGIDLWDLVPGSGPRCQITLEDVTNYLEARKPMVEEPEEELKPEEGPAKEVVETAALPEAPLETAAENHPETDLDEENPLEVKEKESSSLDNTATEGEFADKTEEEEAPVVTPADEDQPIHGQTLKTPGTILLSTEVETGDVEEMRKRITRKTENDTGYPCQLMDFILVAVTRALRDHPKMNQILTGEGMVKRPTIDLGIAVESPEGMVTPLMENMARVGFSDYVSRRHQLVAAAEKGESIKNEKNPSILVVNFEKYGILNFSLPVVDGIQGVLCIGGERELMRMKRGEMTPSRVVTITLSMDGQRADALDGAQFLNRLKSLVENPAVLLF